MKKAASPAASAQSFTANDYSSTNDYVAGADEPDVGLAHLVKTGLRSNAEWDPHVFVLAADGDCGAAGEFVPGRAVAG